MYIGAKLSKKKNFKNYVRYLKFYVFLEHMIATKINNGPQIRIWEKNILCRQFQKISVKIIIDLEAHPTHVYHLRYPNTEHFEPLSYPSSLYPSGDKESHFLECLMKLHHMVNLHAKVSVKLLFMESGGGFISFSFIFLCSHNPLVLLNEGLWYRLQWGLTKTQWLCRICSFYSYQGKP